GRYPAAAQAQRLQLHALPRRAADSGGDPAAQRREVHTLASATRVDDLADILEGHGVLGGQVDHFNSRGASKRWHRVQFYLKRSAGRQGATAGLVSMMTSSRVREYLSRRRHRPGVWGVQYGQYSQSATLGSNAAGHQAGGGLVTYPPTFPF